MDVIIREFTDVKVTLRAKRTGIASSYRTIDLHSGKAVSWPTEPLPALTGPEAISMAKRLWRHFAGRGWPGTWKTGRGNHRTYPRNGAFLVNPHQGWKRVIHDLSHVLYQALTRQQYHRVKTGRTELPNGNWRWVFSDTISERQKANYATASRKDHTDDHAQLEKAMIRMVVESGWLDGKLKPKTKTRAA